MDLSQWYFAVNRFTCWMIVLGALSSLLWIWITYEVLEAAIKNGINASDLVSGRRTDLAPKKWSS